MNNLQDNNIQQTEALDELEIFGRSKSREEIKAEKKAERARELEALREARRLAKEAHKAQPKEKRRDLMMMGVVLLVVLAVCGVILGLQIAKANKEALYEMSETNTGYFSDEDAMPELSEDGLSVVINEMYYTKGEHLCVKMTIGNGVDSPMRLDSLEVKIYNGETDELIAGGYTEDISNSYIVAVDGYDEYTLYIRPEHVKIKDDTLDMLTYEITAEGTMMEE